MSERSVGVDAGPVGRNPAAAGTKTVLIVALALTGFSMRTAVTSVGATLDEIERGLHTTSGVAGLLTTLPVVCFAGLGSLAPRLAARFGQHRLLVVALLVAHVSTAPPQSHFAGRRVADGNRLLETFRNVRGTAQTRLSQLPTLDRALNDAQNSGHPYVLAGDFNNPPRGIFHRHLKARLTDGFAQAGWGSGFTFPARLPLMRIDYLWLGRGVRAKRVWVTDTSASDHRAIVGDLDVADGE